MRAGFVGAAAAISVGSVLWARRRRRVAEGTGRTRLRAVADRDFDQSHEEWASILRHDLLQPVNSILLRTDLMLRAGPSEKARKSLQHVRVAALHLARMMRDFVDAWQLETSRLHVSLERIELGQLIVASVERMADALPRTKVRVPADRSLFVRGDAERLEQVVGTLLSIGSKLSAPDTDISLDLDEVNGNAEIAITSLGSGMPEEELPTLFQSYLHSRGAKRGATKGSELGLYIAKGLVEAHGGRIWADSRPGESTTFRFSIPLEEHR